MYQNISRLAEKLTGLITRWTGTTSAFILAVSLIVSWVIGAMVFNLWTDTLYNLAINDITTIITFALLFLLQRSQNKESAAIQLKLDELLAVSEKASNKMIGIESMTERQVKELHGRFQKLAEETGGHSIEEVSRPSNSTLKWMCEEEEGGE